MGGRETRGSATYSGADILCVASTHSTIVMCRYIICTCICACTWVYSIQPSCAYPLNEVEALSIVHPLNVSPVDALPERIT